MPPKREPGVDAERCITLFGSLPFFGLKGFRCLTKDVGAFTEI
jgi:hypothetical protein